MIPGYLSAQKDTVMYYSIKSDPVNSPKEAFYYEKLSKISSDHFEMVRFHNFKGKWKEAYKTQIYANTDTSFVIIDMSNNFKPDTLLRYYHRCDSNYLVSDYIDSVLISRGRSKYSLPLVKVGNWIYYDKKTSKPEKEEVYANNKVVTNKLWINDIDYVTDVFQLADKHPEYKGGQDEFMNYLSSNLVYPKFAMKNGIQGIVFVSVIITDSGLLKGAKIIRGVEKSLDDEAIRVISTIPNNWIPAKNGDKNVSAFMNIPISFKLK